MISQYFGKIKNICLLTFICTLWINTGFAQDKEKIYVHSDRNDYSQGDTIWLRNYLMGDVGSGIIYTEITDKNKKLICRTLFYSDCNLFEGYLVLPDTIPNGVYLLRAYTNFLRNYGE